MIEFLIGYLLLGSLVFLVCEAAIYTEGDGTEINHWALAVACFALWPLVVVLFILKLLKDDE